MVEGGVAARGYALLILIGLVCFLIPLHATKTKEGLIQRINDSKDFKKFIKTHTNVLVVFAKSERHVSGSWTLLNEVALQMKGLASIVFLDCSLDKKLCKKLKSSTETFELKHYKDGEFHKVYDRKMTVKSMANFLRDPKGDIPWEEDSSATDVHHLDTKMALSKLLTKESRPLLIMFYAPWCGYCQRLKPDFAAAATELKGDAILAGMDVDKPENVVVRTEFNITGFPTLVYFENGHLKYKYGGENSKDGIVQWMKSPSPPKEPEKEVAWSEVESEVVHLTDATFDEFISTNPSVIVMFYAPWCGHCKKMKPEYEKAAAVLKEEEIAGALAAVDATAEKELATRFQVKGYPSVKYFKDGKEAWDFNERTSEKIIEFLKDPKEPPPPPVAEPAWEDVPGYVKHLDDEIFKPFVKKKKHTLVMFYAPWCNHCKQAKPKYMSAAEKFKEDSKVAFAAVDCTKHSSLCSQHDVTGYPTFKYFNYGKNDQKYMGGREEADFVAFMTNPLDPLPSSSSPPPVDEKPWSEIAGYENVVQLTEANFDSVIEKHPSVLVMFYAPWCKHCTMLKPSFVEAATRLKDENADGILAAVDLTIQRNLNSRFSINGFPTLKLFQDGKEAFEYDRGRNTDDIVAFMKNPVRRPAPPSNWMNEPGHVHHLVAANFSDFLKDKQRVLVMFYVPWCPHCLKAKPDFWEVAQRLKDTGPDKLIAVMDCSDEKNAEVCVSNEVKGYPAIKLFRNGAFVADYDGNRSPEHILTFMDSTPKLNEEL